MNDEIRIKGAKENNLKNIDLTIPRDKLIVFTGLSAVCRVPVQLRPHVFRTDEQAGRGEH